MSITPNAEPLADDARSDLDGRVVAVSRLKFEDLEAPVSDPPRQAFARPPAPDLVAGGC